MRSLILVFCSCGVLLSALWRFPLKTISLVHRRIFLSCPLLQFYGGAIAATFRGIISICPEAQKSFSASFPFFFLPFFSWRFSLWRSDTQASLTHTRVDVWGQSVELSSHTYSDGNEREYLNAAAGEWKVNGFQLEWDSLAVADDDFILLHSRWNIVCERTHKYTQTNADLVISFHAALQKRLVSMTICKLTHPLITLKHEIVIQAE